MVICGQASTVNAAETPRLERVLFLLALAVYIGTRLVGLTHFPIFFFSDEALQANLAERLLRNGFRDHTGTFLPPYFLNDQRWALSLSVYMHLLTVWLFGKSVFVVRATSAAVTVLGAIGTALALRTIRRNRFWWTAPLVLAAMPVFFLHARTAFETAMTASFYACFLYAYLLYRYRSPLFLFAALLFGAATFYAYTAGQGLMLVTGLLLFFSDLRYHLAQRGTLLAGAALFAMLLAAPYIRYRHLHPDAVREQLTVLHSYWIEPIPLSQKLLLFMRNYLAGLDPRYWFRPAETELVRHRMDGMGFFPLAYLPILAVGMGTCVWNFWRSSAHRMILLAPLGVPFAGAAAGMQILRLLAMVVPAALLVVIGLDQLYRWGRRLLPYAATAFACAGAFTVMAARLTQTALVDGPTWFNNYGLHGMQYGAKQIFDVIREELARSPDAHIFLASSWANKPDEFLDFFLSSSERGRVSIGNVSGHLLYRLPLSEKDLFVMTTDDYETATQSPKVILSRPERTVHHPDGRIGFYFVRMRYADGADAIFAAEREARRQLRQEAISVLGQTLSVRYSMLDMGSLPYIFDGRPQTLIRGLEANPFILEFSFPTPRTLSKVALTLAIVDFELKLEVLPEAGGPPRVFRRVMRNPPPDPRVEVVFPSGPIRTSQVRIEIKDLLAGDRAHVHVRELSFD